MNREFKENLDGVHVFDSEFSLCGDAWDAPDTEADWEAGPFEKTRKRVVTCAKCVKVILFCRGIRVAADSSQARKEGGRS